MEQAQLNLLQIQDAAGRGKCARATSGLPPTCLVQTWQKEGPGSRAWGRNFRGSATAPSEPEVEPVGSLTLGTKSNLDLEPG